MTKKNDKTIILATLSPLLIAFFLFILLGAGEYIFPLEKAHVLSLLTFTFITIFMVIGMIPVFYLLMVKSINNKEDNKNLLLGTTVCLLLIYMTCGMTFYCYIVGGTYHLIYLFIFTCYFIALYCLVMLFRFFVKLIKLAQENKSSDGGRSPRPVQKLKSQD